jgi:hypothetical protein
MQARRRGGSHTRLRALGLLFSFVLGLTLVTAAHAADPHKHAPHAVAVAAITTVDTPSGARHIFDGDLAAAPRHSALEVAAVDTPDSSQRARSRTAQTPQIRGPPEQALA